MDVLGPWHLLLIAGLFVLMFGAKRLPDAARSLGRSARILKTELKDMHDESDPAPSVNVPAAQSGPVMTPVVPHRAAILHQPAAPTEPALDPDVIKRSV